KKRQWFLMFMCILIGTAKEIIIGTISLILSFLLSCSLSNTHTHTHTHTPTNTHTHRCACKHSSSPRSAQYCLTHFMPARSIHLRFLPHQLVIAVTAQAHNKRPRRHIRCCC